MTLNSRPAMDPRWSYHHRAVARAFQLCSITIYNEQLASRTYNPLTNAWSTGEVAIWSGKARIQPKNTAADRNLVGNNTFVQQVEIQIDFAGNTVAGSNGAMVDIRPGAYIIVSGSPIDPMLTKFIYVVKSVINSSNPWQRTLVCEVDMEADPNA